MSAQGRIPTPQLRRLLAADRRAQRATAELRTAVAEAASAGGSVRVIAEAIDRSPTTVQKWIKEQES
jgi:hypothetical protein